MDEDDEQGCKRCQYPFGGLPQLPCDCEQRPDDGRGDQDQQNQLQQRPVLPRYRQEPADLVHRPVPDELDKMEYCGDSLLQKVQYLVEDGVHGGCSAASAMYASCLAIRDSRMNKRNKLLAGSTCEPVRRVPRAIPSQLSQVSACRTANARLTRRFPDARGRREPGNTPQGRGALARLLTNARMPSESRRGVSTLRRTWMPAGLLYTSAKGLIRLCLRKRPDPTRKLAHAIYPRARISRQPTRQIGGSRSLDSRGKMEVEQFCVSAKAGLRRATHF